MQTKVRNILALDVGEKRVGVARADSTTRLAQVVTTLERGEAFWAELQSLCTQQDVDTIVIGLPRNLDGDDTPQTAVVRRFAQEVSSLTGLHVYMQDEALTSRKAEDELHKKGKPYKKADIDALAAVYILEDYLQEVL